MLAIGRSGELLVVTGLTRRERRIIGSVTQGLQILATSC